MLIGIPPLLGPDFLAVLRAMGHDNCVLPSSLRPLDPTLKVAGKAWTVSGYMDRTRTAHDTLV